MIIARATRLGIGVEKGRGAERILPTIAICSYPKQVVIEPKGVLFLIARPVWETSCSVDRKGVLPCTIAVDNTQLEPRRASSS